MQAFDTMNEKISKDETEVYDITTKEAKKTDEINNKYKDIEQYIGYLEIPRINFKRGFYDINSSLNNVEANIEINKKSSYPNISNGNLIIAGHSGTGPKAFFKDLYKLEVNDLLIVTYGGKRYQYKITNIYKEKNTGTIAIKRNYDKTTITLVTCTKDDNSTQTIYIGELDTVE